MNVTKNFCLCDPLTLRARFVKIGTVEANFGAEIAHRLQLGFVDVLTRDINDDVAAEEPRGVSDRLAVIAGGGANKTLFSFLIAQRAHQVHATADFESTRWLQVF